MPRVLIADDEKNIRATLARCFRIEGYVTVEAGDGAEALERIEAGDVDLVVLDLQMPSLDGLGLLEKLQERGIRIPALVLTAHGSIEKAVRAVRLGAFDFIEKPPETERLLLAARNALRIGSLEEENRRLAEEAGLGTGMIGSSKAMKDLLEAVRRVAPTDAGVLILGENGTGKELVARAIHEASPRRTRPLVTVNCAAIPETLFESELFGHERGAFTGATDPRRGKFQQADGGTLFLDEIGEIPLSLQPKMLRALESGEVERVGGRGPERVNVRVIAATNRDLKGEVARGRFREDLYYRLLVVPLEVPPLRARAGDIDALATSFLESACRRNRIRPKRLESNALAALRTHAWPGNVRELRNTMERIAILAAEPVIDARQIEALHGVGEPIAGRGDGDGHPIATGQDDHSASGSEMAGKSGEKGESIDLAGKLAQYERTIILEALEKTHWRMSRAARVLNLERSHLYKKLKALGIDRPTED